MDGIVPRQAFVCLFGNVLYLCPGHVFEGEGEEEVKDIDGGDRRKVENGGKM